jgi:hypothetical protein
LPWKRKKIIFENRIKKTLLYAAFTVRHAHGLLPQQKTLKGSRDLLDDKIGQWKRASVMDAGPKKGCLTVENAECSLVRQSGTSIFAANVKSIPAVT